MIIHFELDKQRYQSDLSQCLFIAIPLTFSEDQPNHFAAPRAKREPLQVGSFTGNIEQGGSCNVDSIHLVPHCNGTHTESIAHICNQAAPIHEHLIDSVIPTTLITIQPQLAENTVENYHPKPETNDLIITAGQLKEKLSDVDQNFLKGLVIRTLPNLPRKMILQYNESSQPAYFSIDAVEFLVGLGVQHLLTDLPSVDKMYDEGHLSAHHHFWQLNNNQHCSPRVHATITEMIYVPDTIQDDNYLLNLQIAPFMTDASPSRPVLYPVEKP